MIKYFYFAIILLLSKTNYAQIEGKTNIEVIQMNGYFSKRKVTEHLLIEENSIYNLKKKKRKIDEGSRSQLIKLLDEQTFIKYFVNKQHACNYYDRLWQIKFNTMNNGIVTSTSYYFSWPIDCGNAQMEIFLRSILEEMPKL